MTSLHFCSHGAALLVRWFGSGRRSELKGSKIAGQVKEAKGGRNKSRPLSLMLALEVKSSSNSFEVFRPGGPSRTARGRVQHEHPTAPRGLSRGRPASLGGRGRGLPVEGCARVCQPLDLTAKRNLADRWRRCGDGRDAGFLQRVIGNGARVDAAFLDPPYNVRIGGHAVAAGRHREFAMASGEMSEADFRSFLTDPLGAAARVLRDGAVHFVCMDWRHMDDVSAVGLTRRSR